MTDQHGGRQTPLVLLVNQQEWTARSVESVLRPAGYAVVKAYTGRQATEVAGRMRPDLVVVDYRLPDLRGLDTCRAISELPTVDKATPFVITSAASLSRRERHECFKAGIWEIFSSPFDPVEFLGKLDTFLGARREVESAWQATHRAPGSGLYNWNGLLVRAAELVADAQRSRRWTACVAIGLKETHQPEPPDVLDRTAITLADVTRHSDAAGVLGSRDFLVLAPGTDEEGAAIMAGRLIDLLVEGTGGKQGRRSGAEFAAGYYAALDEKGGSLTAQVLMERTVEALRRAKKSNGGSRSILPFRFAQP